MKFEDLSTEILLEVFQWLDYLDLFHAFSDLNARFNDLILIHYPTYHLDLCRLVKPKELHLICQEHLPRIVRQVISLKLSNADQTPHSLEFFVSYDLSFDQFYRLQSLSLDSIHSLSLLNEIFAQCQDLPYLTHVALRRCHFQERDHFAQLIVHLWRLSKLSHCRIEHRLPYELNFSNDTTISSSLEYLFLENFQFNSQELANLFYCTPSLRSFHGTIESHSDCLHWRLSYPSSIAAIQLSFRKSSYALTSNLLSKLPNLTRLTLKSREIFLNGYDWKNLIQNTCPKLKIFRLKMNFQFSRSIHAEEQLETLINSFQSSFWIEEHQWFVHCHWICTSLNNFGTLYTLPYAFNEFLLTNQTWLKSTGSIDNKYDHVRTLTMINLRTNLADESRELPYDFRNIEHLQIHLPLKDSFWSLIHSFHRLKSLDVILVKGISFRPLQLLLDRSPYLTSFCLGNYDRLEIISQLTSTSIDRLDFLTKNRYKRYVDRQQCNALIRSSLGRQCRHLLISIEHRTNILHLLENMSDLRSLTCQCQDDDPTIVLWLRQRLPPTYSVCRERLQPSTIRLWID